MSSWKSSFYVSFFSSISYEVACKALKQETGGILHIHANVEMSQIENWTKETEAKIQSILGTQKWETQKIHLENVKSFAPKICHYVLDLQCKRK